MARTTSAGRGISANTRKLLLAGRPDQGAFTETPQMVVTRVLDKLGRDKGEIVVFNDEAHHCYQPKDLDERLDADTKEANEDARVWFKGLVDIRRYGNRGKDGIKTIYDLSATPFYLKGSGYGEGSIFPWVVSDFGLMDAIESGIVKVPRLPVDDNAQADLVTYLHLYDQVKDDPSWPKRVALSALPAPGTWNMPAVLEGGIRSLYKSYEAAYEDWKKRLKPLDEPPPVMIVVTPNTLVSKLVHDWIAGYDVIDGEQTRHVKGNLPLFSNVESDQPVAIPRTIVVDSKQLESGGAMKDDFKMAAAEEIDAFKQAYRKSKPGADVDKLDDSDLLREVMNTVGKGGKLGEQVRCVVSVAMLTEGGMRTPSPTSSGSARSDLSSCASRSSAWAPPPLLRGRPRDRFVPAGVRQRVRHPVFVHPSDKPLDRRSLRSRASGCRRWKTEPTYRSSSRCSPGTGSSCPMLR